MTTPATPAEQLLLLGADFTRHNDELARLRLNDSSSATALTHQAAADEREALEGDHDAITALANRLADTPTPAGPTPAELGTTDTFIPLTTLLGTLAPTRPCQTGGAS